MKYSDIISLIEEEKKEQWNQIVLLTEEIFLNEETAGEIKQQMSKTQQEIERVKPDEDKMLAIAKKFLAWIRDKLYSIGRYTVDEIRKYLYNYAEWLKKITGLKAIVATV